MNAFVSRSKFLPEWMLCQKVIGKWLHTGLVQEETYVFLSFLSLIKKIVMNNNNENKSTSHAYCALFHLDPY